MIPAWLAIKAFLGGFSFRAWLIIAAVVVFATWTIFTYKAGYSAADAMWEAKALEAKIAKLELEAKIQREADILDDQYRAELEAEKDRLEKVTDAYLEELKNRPDRCLLGDDADKLQ